MIKYIGMYLLLDLICNWGLIIGIGYYIGTKTKWNKEALSDIIDILYNKPAGSGLGKLYTSIISNQTLLVAILLTQLIWPLNAAFLLERLPCIVDYVHDFNKEP